jgi:hypothetical protein
MRTGWFWNCLAVHGEALDADHAVGEDVDDDFAAHAFGFGTFLGGGDGDVELGLGFAELPADDEKAQQQEQDVDHRCQLDGDRWRLAVGEFHPVVN